MRKIIVLLTLFCHELVAQEPDLAPLAKWLKFQSSVESIKADFRQTRKLKTVGRDLTTEGKLWVKFPDRFCWQMGDPARAIIRRNGDLVQFKSVKSNSVKQFKADSAEGKRYAFMTNKFAASLDEFKDSFTVTKVRQEKDVYYVTFQPKKSALRKRLPYLALGIYTATNHLGLFEMHLQDGSVIRTTFTNYKYNVAIDNKVFKLERSTE